MAFDFDKVERSGALSTITDPADLFDALPNKASGYGYLRAVQKVVLDAWSDRRDERDLVIKTNTGGGKTVAGLLILQVCLHERKGPALYVAPDQHLAAQVRDEAEALGIPVVTEPDAQRFLSSDAICVTTMNVLMNGRSRFGVKGSYRQATPVGSVVVDDAHAALVLTEQKTHLRVPRDHQAYDELVDIFRDDLKAQGHNALLDIEDNDRAGVLRIPFWSWFDRQDQVLNVLRPHRDDDPFQFTWPLIASLTHICSAVISAEAIEIVPPCPPIEMIPSFDEAARRVYLTATLADDSVLVTHFRADPVSIASSIVPDSAGDLGDRLILAPEELCTGVTHAAVRAEMRTLSTEHNVVVLVPSHRKATMWEAEADRVASTNADISLLVNQLRGGHVGLAVIVNRYDGIDLPDRACRVLVIDGLPQAYTGAERREAVALRDSDAMVARQLQRLEQGMGRGVRSRDDRCAVLLLDSRLTALVARSDVADRLSPATRAQLEVSRRVAADLEGMTLRELIGVVRQVVDGDAGFRELSRDALVGVIYEQAAVSPIAGCLREAHDAAVAGRFEKSADAADRAVKAALAARDPRLAGWLGETLATYLHPIDASRAQNALSAALERNPAVLRPVGGLTYQRVTPAAAQAQEAALNLAARYDSGTLFRLGVDAVLADIAWDNERTDEAEAAFADLALHLGIASQRPERDYGRGSDVLWVTAPDTYIVLEAKTGATGDLIWKKDINQLAGSVNWCSSTYGTNAAVTPLIVHPRDTVDKSATPPHGTRVLTDDKLKSLKIAVRAFATALALDNRYADPAEVRDQLAANHLLPAAFIDSFTVPAKVER